MDSEIVETLAEVEKEIEFFQEDIEMLINCGMDVDGLRSSTMV
jgi:hypothetical protein